MPLFIQILESIDSRSRILESFVEQPFYFALATGFVLLALCIFIYMPLRFIHRLYFDPLSNIPGPRLLLISRSLYYLYWWRSSARGVYLSKIDKWHKQYGPIFRLGPDAVHIKDIESYHHIFKVGTKFPKARWYYDHPIARDAFVGDDNIHSAAVRRSAFHQYFSKKSIRDLEYLIASKIDRFSDRLAGMESINFNRGLRCLTCDVITAYSYEESFEAVEDPNFSPRFILAFERFLGTIGFHLVIPVTFRFLVSFVRKIMKLDLAKKLFPNLASALELKNKCGEAVLCQKQKWEQGNAGDMISIFEQTFRDYPEKNRKALTKSQLMDDAFIMLLAGMDNTADTMALALYEIIKDPAVYAKLLGDLKEVMPKPTSPVTVDELERIPLLKAIIKEAHRFQPSFYGPLPRIVPPTGYDFLGYQLPPGTSVLHSQHCYHNDPIIFPDPSKFDANRWLVSDTTELEHYSMPFSRGARNCIGTNLAAAEIILVVAKLVRRYEFKFTDDFRHENMEFAGMIASWTKGYLTVTAKEWKC